MGKEKNATYASYKKYQQSYYPVWKPEFEQYVAAQAIDLSSPVFDSIAKVNAITYQMIYQQPIIYELQKIMVPVLLIIGQEDRTVVGKDQLNENDKKKYGNYPMLGKKLKSLIKNSKLIELKGAGHIPHIQQTDIFINSIKDFIAFSK